MLPGDGTRSDTYADMRCRIARLDHRWRGDARLVPAPDGRGRRGPGRSRPPHSARMQRPDLRKSLTDFVARDVSDARGRDVVVEPEPRCAGHVPGWLARAHRECPGVAVAAGLRARADGDLAGRRLCVSVWPRAG